MANTKKGMSKIALTAVGVGAAAVAAAGAYWFYGSKNASEHRRNVRSWMLKARADVLEAVEDATEKAGEVSKEMYTNIVEEVLKRYSMVAGVTSAEIRHVKEDMKETWDHLQKQHKIALAKKKKEAKK